MITLPDLTSLISQQLAQHGVSVEERVARDVAAQILTILAALASEEPE